MTDNYAQMKEKSRIVLELVASCLNNSDKTLRLSGRILGVINEVLSLSKRFEGNIPDEAAVLKEKVELFLKHPENEKVYGQIREIATRIYEESSSY